MNVLFFDLDNSGHHFFYNYNAMSFSGANKYYFTEADIDDQKVTQLKSIGVTVLKTDIQIEKNAVSRIVAEWLILAQLREMVSEKNIDKIIFLYFDQIIISSYLFQLIKPIKCHKMGVLHWLPRRSVNLKSLKRASETGLSIVVHTEHIKSRLFQSDVKNVKLIHYPIIEGEKTDDKIEKESICQLGCIIRDAKTILYFGGTRYDKGLDLFIEALKYVKHELNVIIAGSEQFFKRDFIKEKTKLLFGKNIILDLAYISDEKMHYYYDIADIVAIPYRKIFSGESGVFVEAMSNKNIVVVPNIIHFTEAVAKYSNGEVYEAEDMKDMGIKIDRIIENFEAYTKGRELAHQDYKKKHCLQKFSNSYKQMILGEQNDL